MITWMAFIAAGVTAPEQTSEPLKMTEATLACLDSLADELTADAITSFHAQIATTPTDPTRPTFETPALRAGQKRAVACVGQGADTGAGQWAQLYVATGLLNRALAAYLKEKEINPASVAAIANLPEFKSFALWSSSEESLVRQIGARPEIRLSSDQLEAIVYYLTTSRLIAVVRRMRVAPARPAKRASGTIGPEDYPEVALSRGHQGTTEVAVFISPDGSVNDCTLLFSSGSPALDKVACRLILERFRYVPARDAAGRPVADIEFVRQRWLLR